MENSRAFVKVSKILQVLFFLLNRGFLMIKFYKLLINHIYTKEANACMKLISQLLYSIELLLYLNWSSGGTYTKFCTTYECCNATWDRPAGSLK